MYKKITLLLLFVLSITVSYAEDPWELNTNKEGIKVYTRHVANSKIKAIKVECYLNATPAQLVAVLMDINTCDQWVYHTKSSRIIKRVSPSEIYYYSEVQVPWPVENRDFIAHIKVSQDAKTKVVTVDAPCLPDMVPVKDGVVRIEHSSGQWIITPMDNGQIKVEYTLHVDPAGTVPSWLINLFASAGPMETFKGLKVQLQKPAYQNAHVPYIVD